MRIRLVTDAFPFQVNGVLRALKSTARKLSARGHEVEMIAPPKLRTLPCPTFPDIRLCGRAAWSSISFARKRATLCRASRRSFSM